MHRPVNGRRAPPAERPLREQSACLTDRRGEEERMRVELRSVADQVIVITGASSGIGLVTAKMAARQGAKVVLAARNKRALERAVRAIEGEGGQATYVVADVAEPDDMEDVARAAVEEFGRIDTWVNNASTSIYGRLD